MKITVFSGGFAGVGGVETFLFDLLCALPGRGIESRLCCWDAVSPRHNPALTEIARHGVAVSRSPWRWGCRWAWPDKLLLGAAQSTLLDSDVVLFGKPLHASVHRRLVALRAGRPSPRFVLLTPYRPAEMCPEATAPEVFGSFDRILVQAASFADDLRVLGYRGDVAELPYIPPPCTPVRAIPRGPLRIGFLGRLVPDKNLFFLLEAFRAILRSREAELHLFGDGPLGPDLRKTARRLSLNETVRFHGMISPAAVPQAIDSCGVFAFPSLIEGQCRAALEVLARGRPVVASCAGAFPEMLSDARLGGAVSLGDPDDFGQAILGVCDRGIDPAQIQSTFATRYDRNRIFDSYLRLLSA